MTLVDGRREPSEGQLIALERLTRLRAALGEGTFGLIVAVVVDERTWVSLARRCGVQRSTVRAQAIAALKMLASGW